MKAIGGVALAALAGVFIVALVPPRSAQACSAGPDYNPVVDVELIVAGYITDVEILGRTGVMTYLDLGMTLEVDEYLYGDGPDVLRVFDGASGTPPPELIPNSAAFQSLDLNLLNIDDLGYGGGDGGCGALDEDPRGRY